MQKTTVKIDGMMCGMCESHVCDAIRNALKVKKVTASHKKGEAVLLSENDFTDDAITSALDGTGYRVLSVTREAYVKKGLFSRL